MKNVLFVFIGVGVFLSGAVAYMLLSSRVSPPQPEYVMCPQEAKVCPDGTTVIRVGSKCEFAQCPSVKGKSTVSSSTSKVFESGKKLVVFRSFKQNGLSVDVQVDEIEMLKGDEAIAAALQYTGCTKANISSGGCAPSLNNGYYIVNKYVTTEQLSVGLSTEIYLISVADTSKVEKVGLLEMKKKYDNGELTGLGAAPFWITINGGKITKIEQQYIP